MIRPAQVLRMMGITPKTVIHVGGHLAQDQTQYELLGVEQTYWCEADEHCASEIRRKFPSCNVITGLFWSDSGQQIDFWLMKDKAQNSIFKPKDESHALMRTRRITTSIDKEFLSQTLQGPIMLVLDVQGAETQVLEGARKLLEQIDYIVCEITDEAEYSQFSVSEKEINNIVIRHHLTPLLRRYSHTKKYYDLLFVKKRFMSIIRILLVEQLYISIRVSKKLLSFFRKEI